MLDKIQAIQNPDKTSYTTKQLKDKSLPVKAKKVKADISLLKANDTSHQRTIRLFSLISIMHFMG